jgi:hypothetical protein
MAYGTYQAHGASDAATSWVGQYTNNTAAGAVVLLLHHPMTCLQHLGLWLLHHTLGVFTCAAAPFATGTPVASQMDVSR